MATFSYFLGLLKGSNGRAEGQVTDGAIHVREASSIYGNYPATWYLAWTGTAGAADNAVIYTSPDVSMYNYHTFTASGTSGCDVEVSHDGTTWDVVAVTLTDDVTTGGGIKVITIPTGKSAFLPGKWKYIRVLEDGPTDANCLGAHSVI
jgi:hypothetical protein